MRNPPPSPSTSKTFIATIFASLIIFLAIGVAAQSQTQTDWRHWTAKDARQVLTNSPWVSTCCREWTGASTGAQDDPTATLGVTASIMSSQIVREAHVRWLQLAKSYQTLASTRRAEADQNIAACLDEKFDKYIVISFSLNFGPEPKFDIANPSDVHLLTSDGRKIAGQIVTNQIALRCGALPSEVNQATIAMSTADLGRHGPHHELAFPRIVDGKPTVGPSDKKIRVVLDFYRKSYPGHSVSDAELDFNVAKLIYQGKPDF